MGVVSDVDASSVVNDPASGVTAPTMTLLTLLPPPETVPPSVMAGSVQVPLAVHVPLPTEESSVLLSSSCALAKLTSVSVAAGIDTVTVPRAPVYGCNVKSPDV